MSDSFDAAVAGLAETLAARLQWYDDTGASHFPHPKKIQRELLKEQEGYASSMDIVERSASKSLETLKDETIGFCEKCDLHQTRTKIVFGAGNRNADLMFIGEAPGAEDDRQGQPFTGKAGALLDKMISAMGYSRESVYICNIVKCRPPNDRAPESGEVARCEPFLKSQVNMVAPKIIVTLGRFASQCLLNSQERIGELRGHWKEYEGYTVMPTFHPAYLLQTPERKREAWHDLQKVMRRLKTNHARL